MKGILYARDNKKEYVVIDVDLEKGTLIELITKAKDWSYLAMTSAIEWLITIWILYL